MSWGPSSCDNSIGYTIERNVRSIQRSFTEVKASGLHLAVGSSRSIVPECLEKESSVIALIARCRHGSKSCVPQHPLGIILPIGVYPIHDEDGALRSPRLQFVERHDVYAKPIGVAGPGVGGPARTASCNQKARICPNILDEIDEGSDVGHVNIARPSLAVDHQHCRCLAFGMRPDEYIDLSKRLTVLTRKPHVPAHRSSLEEKGQNVRHPVLVVPWFAHRRRPCCRICRNCSWSSCVLQAARL